MNCADLARRCASQLTARYPAPSCSVTHGPTMWTPRIRPGRPVGTALGHDLHQALGVADDPGPAVAAEGVLLDHDVDARRLGLGLGQPGERHLGVAVDGPGHPVVVDRHHRLADDALDDHDGLGEAHVGELRRAGDQVAHRPHVLLVGLLELVGHHEAALVEQHRRALARAGPRCAAAGRPTPRPSRPSISWPSPSCTAVPVPSSWGGWPFTWTPVTTSMPRLRNERADHRGDLGVAAGQDGVERLEHGHLRPEVREQRGELAADGPAADHRHRGRQPSRSRNSSEVSTSRPSTSKPGQRPRHRAGGQHDVAADQLGPGVVAVDHPDPPTGQQRPRPGSTVTLRPLSSPDRPSKSWSTTACLRGWLTAKSTSGPPRRRCRTRRRRSPCGRRRPSRGTPWPGRSRGAGTCPPTLSRSTMATRSPAAAP